MGTKHPGMQQRTFLGLGLVLVTTCLIAGVTAHGCRWKQHHHPADPFDHPFFHEQAADDLAVKVDELTEQLESAQANARKLQDQNANQAQQIKHLNGLAAHYKQRAHHTFWRSHHAAASWSPWTPLFFVLLTLGLIKTGVFIGFCLCPGFGTCVLGRVRHIACRACSATQRNCCAAMSSPFATGLCWAVRKICKAAVCCTLFAVSVTMATSFFFCCPWLALLLAIVLPTAAGCCRFRQRCTGSFRLPTGTPRPPTVVVTRVREATAPTTAQPSPDTAAPAAAAATNSEPTTDAPADAKTKNGESSPTPVAPPVSATVPAPAKTSECPAPAEDSSSSEEWDSLVEELKEMGFEGPAAVEAAREADGDVKVAVKLMVKREREAAAAKTLSKDW